MGKAENRTEMVKHWVSKKALSLCVQKVLCIPGAELIRLLEFSDNGPSIFCPEATPSGCLGKLLDRADCQDTSS